MRSAAPARMSGSELRGFDASTARAGTPPLSCSVARTLSGVAPVLLVVSAKSVLYVCNGAGAASFVCGGTGGIGVGASTGFGAGAGVPAVAWSRSRMLWRLSLVEGAAGMMDAGAATGSGVPALARRRERMLSRFSFVDGAFGMMYAGAGSGAGGTGAAGAEGIGAAGAGTAEGAFTGAGAGEGGTAAAFGPPCAARSFAYVRTYEVSAGGAVEGAGVASVSLIPTGHCIPNPRREARIREELVV